MFCFRNNVDKDTQKDAFIRQIKWALLFKKPIVIHCRDAQKDCLDILKTVSVFSESCGDTMY